MTAPVLTAEQQRVRTALANARRAANAHYLVMTEPGMPATYYRALADHEDSRYRGAVDALRHVARSFGIDDDASDWWEWESQE